MIRLMRGYGGLFNGVGGGGCKNQLTQSTDTPYELL